jgi:hypothetical protein
MGSWQVFVVRDEGIVVNNYEIGTMVFGRNNLTYERYQH